MTSYFYCNFIDDVSNGTPTEYEINGGYLEYRNDDIYCCIVLNGYGQMELTIPLGCSDEFCEKFNSPNKLEKHIKNAIRDFKKQLTETLKDEIII